MELMKIINTKEEWESYLDKFIEGYNILPELPAIIQSIAPLVFNYVITDRPEMSYWFLIEKDKISWGLGQYSGTNHPTIIHKTDFETMKKVNSGETDPIQATMLGTYNVDGDVSKLMACASLLPLGVKAHAYALEKIK